MKTFRTIAIAGIVSFIVSAAAYAQGYSIKGKIIDLNRSPLPGALVRLIDPGDSTRAYVTSTNLDGAFMFSGVPQQTYTLRVTAVGKRTLNVVLRPAGNILDIGSLAISDEPIHVRGVTVEGRIPAAVQVGDTTEYAANAVKVNRDATMEDLLSKLPGIIPVLLKPPTSI
ncbi:MAG TPA: carboxypeptidase-like regulatory domain-containing protein, partial [Candidatus Kryptobacter bacterium]|nr:carboxypeptidase-like regulatory domain-containing protein [Candidatus Kryptobacter bacterium]